MSIEFNVDAALAKVEALVQAHGAQAVDIATHVAQIDAINKLTGIPGWGAMVALTYVAMRFCFKRAQQDEDSYDDSLGWWLGVVFSAIGGVLFCVMFLTSLLDVWAWVGLFNPKLALAHEILSKLGASQ